MKSYRDFIAEATVTVDHSRLDGKNPREFGGPRNWLFTHKKTGDVDRNDIFECNASFSDASKAAKHWAKSKGYDRVYTMESLDESAYLGPDTGNSPSIRNSEVYTGLDAALQSINSETYITPHIAFTKVRKVLASRNMFMDESMTRLPVEEGEYFFQIRQFGIQKDLKTDSGKIHDEDDVDDDERK